MPCARERWKPLVERLEASTLSLAAFARREGVNRNTLAWWRSRFRREAREGREAQPAVVFTELAVAPPKGTRPLQLHLEGRAVRLDVDCTTDLALLRDVLDALC